MRKILLLFFLGFITVVHADTGAKVGFSYLKIAVDSRAAAMGEAYTSITNDVSATFWNPAGLAAAEKNSVLLMHNSWLQDINHEFAAIQFVNGKHNLAVSLNLINVSGIELREETASVNPIGVTQALNTYLGISYATTILESWLVGVQLKYLYEKYYLNSADGFALDLGVKKDNLIPDLGFGFVVQNIGKMSALKNQSTDLPFLVRAGINYRLPFKILNDRLLVAADFAHILHNTSTVGLGLEATLLEYVDIRFGYVFGRESQNITAGFGLGFGIFNISYAFVPYRYDLGNSHRFSLLVEL